VLGEILAGAALNGERGALRGRRSIPIHVKNPGGTPGMMVGRPGVVRAEMLWLSVPKAGGGLCLPPPPVIGKRRNPVAGAPQAQR